MAIETADDLFLDELRDVYSAEKQAIRAYPKVAKKITSEKLKAAVQQHLEQIQEEKEADAKLTEVSKGVNREALGEQDDDEEDDDGEQEECIEKAGQEERGKAQEVVLHRLASHRALARRS